MQHVNEPIEHYADAGSYPSTEPIATSPVDPSNGSKQEKLFEDSGNRADALCFDEIGNETPTKKKNFIVRFAQWLLPYGGLASNCFSIASVTLGAGIIAVPRSFAMSGIVMSVIYLVVVAAVTIYAMTLMGYAMEKTGVYNFEALARVLFGPGWDYFVSFVLWLSAFGTAVAYISAVSSLITPILEKAPGTPAYLKTTSGNRLITSLIWLVLLVPVVIPKRVNSIRYVSAFSVVMVFYFVVVIVVHSSTNGLKKGLRGDMEYFTTGNQAVYGLSIFIFAFLCQTISGPVFSEQRPRPSVKQLTIASAISTIMCTIFYVLVGVFGYFDFADDTQDSILENFDPVQHPYVMVAYVGMFIKICTSYAMNMVSRRNFIYRCLKWDLDTVPYWKHIPVVLAMSTVILIAGLFIPSISSILGLVGSLCGGFIGFLFPAFFWMYSGKWNLKTVGIWHWLATYFLIVSGVIAIVFGTISTVYYSVTPDT